MMLSLTEEQQVYLAALLLREKQNLDMIEQKLSLVMSDVLTVDENINISGIFSIQECIESKQDHLSNMLYRLQNDSEENMESLKSL